MNFLLSAARMRLLSCLLVILCGFGAFDAQAAAKCHDACDRAAVSCDKTDRNCVAIRESCLRRCDADPRLPSNTTRMRVQESEDEWRTRVIPNNLPKLSGCQIRCEDSARTCQHDNPDAGFCETAEASCITRCEKRRR